MASNNSLDGLRQYDFSRMLSLRGYDPDHTLPITKGMLATGLLPIVEERFEFLDREFGFKLTQTSELPVGAWYRAAGRAVILSYDFSQEPALEISLEDTALGQTHLLATLLGTPATGSAGTPGRTHESLAAEMDRQIAPLRAKCAAFLAGDLPAFRRTFRETILVQACRNAAMGAFYAGDLKRAAVLFSDLREYWTEIDREHYTRATTEKALPAFLLGRR